SLSALSTLRLTNTRSIATSPGPCRAMSSRRLSKMTRSRSGRNSSAAATVTQPCATCTQSTPRRSMTPYPVRRDPGSRPRIRRPSVGASGGRAAPGSNARQDLVRYLDIRVHVPHIIQLFQRLEQVHHPLRRLAGKRSRQRGALRHLRGGRHEAAVREDRTHGLELHRVGEYLDGAIGVGNDVLGAGVERGAHQPILIGARREGHETDVIEKIAHGAFGPEVPPVLAEGAAQVRPGAVTVVGDALDQHRRATWAVALVAHGLETTGLDLDTAPPGGLGPPPDDVLDVRPLGVAGHK